MIRSFVSTFRTVALSTFACVALLIAPTTTLYAQTAAYVQSSAAVPQTALSTVSATFNSVQTAGNLIVAVVGWNDTTARVQTVTDSRGHAYVLAVGPTVRNGFGSQAIYYAKNIQASTAGGNAVTVTFDRLANYVDLRIAEYSGLDRTNPVDVTVAANGSSNSTSSGNVTTTNARDLLVGANLVSSRTTGAGTNYISRLITVPDGDILEDRSVTSTGSYSATAPVSPSGPWIMQMVAFRVAAADTQAPTTPGSVTATPVSSTQINLSWAVSTDNVGVTNYLVERCLGASCSNFAQIGTTATLTFNSTGLSASTTYRFRVRATDAAANLSAYSTIVNATTQAAGDTQAPTTPAGLSATSQSSTQIALAWTASTDNVGVTSYLVDRCQGSGCSSFSQVGTSSTPSFADSGLAATTNYSYRVRATDAAANLSGYSNVGSATTPAAPDTLAPTSPSSLVSTSPSSTQISLAWTASTDNVGVTSYLVERCQGGGCSSFSQVGTSTTPSFADLGLSGSTSYSYRVRATDAAANLSGYSNVSSTTTSASPDTQAPTAPSSLVAAPQSATQINLTWTASSDNVGVTNYQIERCQGSSCSGFAQIGTSSSPGFSDSALTPSTNYSYRVRATDAAANLSTYSNVSSAATQASADTQPPTAPSGLSATAQSTTQINLVWTASTDDVAVSNYLIERCQGSGCSDFAQIGMSAVASFGDSGLSPATTYAYRVRASDGAGNLSSFSNSSSTNTLSPSPSITSLSPNSGSVGATVTISGTNFGSSQGASTVTFNGAPASASTWTASSIAVTVPGAATSGNVVVTVNGVPSNGVGFTVIPAAGPITLVQHVGKDAGSTTSSTLAFSAPNTAGNWIGVAIRAGISGQTFTVIDTRNNTYRKAVQLNETVDGTTLALYYAENIAAGVNTVSVTDNLSGGTLRFAILEYSGIATSNSFDTAAAAQGSNSTPNSGAMTTTANGDLIIGLVSTANPATFTAGSGFAIQERVPAAPNTKLALEDQRQTNAGAISAATTLGSSDQWGAVVAAFKVPVVTVDVQSPTAPAGLNATVISSSRVDLSWTASTDNVGVTNYLIERCQGPSCSAFAQIATAAGAAFSNTSLTASTTYSYRVRATDAAGNLSAFSNVATGTTPAPPDTQAPTSPSSLAATASSSTQVSLGWTASTDNVGVASYLVERCLGAGCSSFLQIGTSPANSFADPGLTGSATYNYRVRAVDAAGNVSGYSNVATVATPAPPDTQAPTAPTSLLATVQSTSQIALSWSAASDNVGVTNYLIERCQGSGCSGFIQIGTSVTTGFSDSGLSDSTTFNYRVRATDAAGNTGLYSNIGSATTASPADTDPPSAPSNLSAIALSSTQIGLTWSAATDNVAVTAYLVERCQDSGCTAFVQVGSATTLTFNDSGLTATTTYRYRVRARDAAGNLGDYSNLTEATPPAAADTQPPSAPSGLSASAIASDQISLTWVASSDNVGVSQYSIERCQGTGCSSFAEVGAASSPAFNSAGLSQSTSYSYRVRASDVAGNASGYSNVATAVTQAIPDTQPPSDPSNLTATPVSSTQIDLTWTASADNVGVTAYLIEECLGAACTNFTQVGTSTGTSLSRVGLSSGTIYRYRVRATDAALNSSNYSMTVNAATLTVAPIAFVQTNNAVPQSSPTSVSVVYTGAQTAGDLNVVVVGWNSQNGTVASVTDTVGNTYVRAVGPTVRAGFGTQSIYYAANILTAAANANTVRVTFSGATSHPDIRIAEYRGIATTNPVDVVAAATGSGTSTSSGSATTTNPNDLLVGANLVSSFTTDPGPSFTSRVVTTPDGDILEDRIVTSVGSYSATAVITSGDWIMQMVAFKAASTGPDVQAPTAPAGLAASAVSASQVNLTWTGSTDNVGVVNYVIERCAGGGCGGFSPVGTSTGLAFTDTGVVEGSSYSYRVLAADAAGNQSAYSNTATVVTPAPDTQPPSVPGQLVATAVSGTRIDLSWGPATDNVSVTGYRVEQCTGVGCTTFVKLATVTGTTYSDTGLTPNTTYNYVVRAQDAANLLGPYSNTAGVTTLATIPELVAAYSFDEGIGTTVDDASGRNNTGALQNAVWSTAGKYGNALRFNGDSALVTVADAASLRLTSAMTLEAWVNLAANSSAWRDVIYKGNDNYFLEATTSSGGVPAAGVILGSTNTVAFASTVLPLNTWVHLAETYDGTTLRLYVNGSQAASVIRSGSIRTSSNPLQIGGDDIFGQFFEGLIDEVRIYNVALSPTQIQADMNRPVGNSVPILSYSPTSIDFGSLATSQTSSPQSVALTNSGGSPLNIDGILLGGLNASDFVETHDCGSVLPPSASCSIQIRFAPSAADIRSGKITIISNAPGAPHVVTLSGVGLGFTIVPRTSVVTPISTQQFSVSGGTAGTWLVDGVEGGSSSSGAISATGLFEPVSGSPGAHVVTVLTPDGLQSSSATVYITEHQGVFTHHNDNARTGQNLNEVVLTPDNVSSASFGKLVSYNLDGNSHASPLYTAGVNVAGVGVRNLVFVATEHNSVYAFDADGGAPAPLWHVNFNNPAAGITSVPSSETGECCDIAPEIGITGTPVIDASTGTLYVVAKTKEVSGSTTTYRQRLHALDIASGAEKFGGPVIIQANAPGSGGGSVGGQVPFDALHENQRPALLLSNGVVYMGFGSHGDVQPYHGWLLGYNAATLARVFVHNSSPNDNGAGMWQANGGPAADADGNVYFVTGNGLFDVNTGGKNYGDSFVKIAPNGNVLDYFTPHNQDAISANNYDLGAAGPLLIPDQPGAHPHLLVSAGKDNAIYLVDRDNMGHYNPANDSQIVQSLVDIFPFGRPEPGNYSAPVYFNGTVYFGPVADTLQAFKLNNGLLSTAPTSASSVAFPYPGASLSVSANGALSGILWAIQRNGDCGVQVTCSSAAPGVLRAFDASNLSVQLYASDQAGGRDALDFAAKFSVPLVVNGKVFVSTIGRLTIYGLLP